MLSLNKHVLVFASIAVLASCGSKKDPNKTYFDNEADYNQYISHQYDQVNELWEYALNLMDDSLKVYHQLDSLEKTALTSAANMQKLADFKGDTMYKYRAQQYFIFMANTASGSYREAVDIALMQETPDSLIFKFENIGKQIGKDKDLYVTQLLQAQQDFITLTQK